MELFKEPLYRRYHAQWFTSAHLISIAFKISLFLLPIFLAYPSYGNEGIWIKQNIYREQPIVAYKYKLILILEAVDTLGNPKQIFYSTLPQINESRQKTFRMANIKSEEIDNNNDGKLDQLELKLAIPLFPNESIHSIQALIFFDYQLLSHAKISMESLVYIQKSFPLPSLGLSTFGNLKFRQTLPLPVREQISTLYVNSPLLEGKKKSKESKVIYSARDTNIEQILQKYSKRAYTIEYEELYLNWKTNFGRLSNFSSNDEYEYKDFHFHATINYPLQEVRYIPTVLEVLKDAWIKYLSLAVIVGYFLNKISSFVFFHQM